MQGDARQPISLLAMWPCLSMHRPFVCREIVWKAHRKLSILAQAFHWAFLSYRYEEHQGDDAAVARSDDGADSLMVRIAIYRILL